MRWLTYDLKIVVLTSIYGTVRSFIYVVYCLTITIVYVFLTHFIWNEWFRERCNCNQQNAFYRVSYKF